MISDSNKEKAWIKYISNKNIQDVVCSTGCGRKITHDDFQCGLHIHTKNGGRPIISNIRVICTKCLSYLNKHGVGIFELPVNFENEIVEVIEVIEVPTVKHKTTKKPHIDTKDKKIKTPKSKPIHQNLQYVQNIVDVNPPDRKIIDLEGYVTVNKNIIDQLLLDQFNILIDTIQLVKNIKQPEVTTEQEIIEGRLYDNIGKLNLRVVTREQLVDFFGSKNCCINVNDCDIIVENRTKTMSKSIDDFCEVLRDYRFGGRKRTVLKEFCFYE